jgi:hypothetical protein
MSGGRAPRAAHVSSCESWRSAGGRLRRATGLMLLGMALSDWICHRLSMGGHGADGHALERSRSQVADDAVVLFPQLAASLCTEAAALDDAYVPLVPTGTIFFAYVPLVPTGTIFFMVTVWSRRSSRELDNETRSRWASTTKCVSEIAENRTGKTKTMYESTIGIPTLRRTGAELMKTTTRKPGT